NPEVYKLIPSKKYYTWPGKTLPGEEKIFRVSDGLLPMSGGSDNFAFSADFLAYSKNQLLRKLGQGVQVIWRIHWPRVHNRVKLNIDLPGGRQGGNKDGNMGSF